jgi:hypothetical protein
MLSSLIIALIVTVYNVVLLNAILQECRSSECRSAECRGANKHVCNAEGELNQVSMLYNVFLRH